jgi:hypothetical protein
MQLRIPPDDIAGAAARLAEDGPALRGLASVLSGSRPGATSAATGHTRLASALDGFLECQQAGLATLAETADLLVRGLGAAASFYGDTEARAEAMLGSAHG